MTENLVRYSKGLIMTWLQNRQRKGRRQTSLKVNESAITIPYFISYNLVITAFPSAPLRKICHLYCTAAPADCLPNDQHACQGSGPGVLFMADVVGRVHDTNMQRGMPEGRGFLRSQRQMKVDGANHDRPGGALVSFNVCVIAHSALG